ncbi:MAG: hypothetical protein KDD10_30215, partial [Phaeodactylibacter sp.]|nr:hypothetical protein [Phaeodactylibacter sp.]
YTFPALGKRNYGLHLYATAQNLVTFTDFPALDPDTDVFSAGQAEKGAILGNPPAKRIFTFGFNLDF